MFLTCPWEHFGVVGLLIWWVLIEVWKIGRKVSLFCLFPQLLLLDGNLVLQANNRWLDLPTYHWSRSPSIWSCCPRCAVSTWSESSPARLWCGRDSTADPLNSPSTHCCWQTTGTVRAATSAPSLSVILSPFSLVSLLQKPISSLIKKGKTTRQNQASSSIGTGLLCTKVIKFGNTQM